MPSFFPNSLGPADLKGILPQNHRIIIKAEAARHILFENIGKMEVNFWE
jgi:hypothetical protein